MSQLAIVVIVMPLPRSRCGNTSAATTHPRGCCGVCIFFCWGVVVVWWMGRMMGCVYREGV